MELQARDSIITEWTVLHSPQADFRLTGEAARFTRPEPEDKLHDSRQCSERMEDTAE